MKKNDALKIVFWISIAGVLFSGYLSYTEVYRQICALGNFGTCTSVFTIPACVYGLAMYTIIAIISYLGMISKK